MFHFHHSTKAEPPGLDFLAQRRVELGAETRCFEQPSISSSLTSAHRGPLSRARWLSSRHSSDTGCCNNVLSPGADGRGPRVQLITPLAITLQPACSRSLAGFVCPWQSHVLTRPPSPTCPVLSCGTSVNSPPPSFRHAVPPWITLTVAKRRQERREAGGQVGFLCVIIMCCLRRKSTTPSVVWRWLLSIQVGGARSLSK